MKKRHWLFFTRRTATFLMVAASSAVLCSCSAIRDPYIIPGYTAPVGETSIPIQKGAPVTFEEATEYARENASLMEKQLKELEHYDLGTGLTILASGVVGLGLTTFGAHADALLGSSLVSGAVFGARSYLPIQDRKIIYASGASAITCAITALSFGVLDSEDSEDSEGDSQKPLSPVRNALDQITKFVSDPNAPRPEESQTITLAKNFVVEVQSMIHARGDRLVAATEAIRHIVNAQLIKARVDPDAALETLRTESEAHANSLREHSKKLQDAAREASDEAKTMAQNDDETNAVNKLRLLANKIDEIDEINKIIANAEKVLEIIGARSACTNP